MSEFTVDLQDPASIAASLKQAERRAVAARARLDAVRDEVQQATDREREANAEFERWLALAHTLRSAGEIMATVSHEPDTDDADPSSKDRALQIVNAIGAPTNIPEVAEHMPPFTRKTVSWALWKLAEEGLIQKLGNGRYASLSYRPNQIKIPPFPKGPGTPVLDAMTTAKVRAAAARRVTEQGS
jgi:hypothetical protein